MKKISLSDNDKQKLRDAFEAAVNASPIADTPAVGWTADGSETTLRKVIKGDLDSGIFYKEMEGILSHGVVTLDTIIDLLKQGKFTLPNPPKP